MAAKLVVFLCLCLHEMSLIVDGGVSPVDVSAKCTQEEEVSGLSFHSIVHVLVYETCESPEQYCQGRKLTLACCQQIPCDVQMTAFLFTVSP